jgi:hypothetical protein
MLPDDKQNPLRSTLSYISQLEETKIGALPILSGQARYVVDLAKAIGKTYGRPGHSPEIRSDLNAQTVRNMMTLTYAIENGFLTDQRMKEFGIDPEAGLTVKGGKLPEKARSLLNSIKLTKEQEKSIEEAINYVNSAPSIRGGKFQETKSVNPADFGLNPDEWEIVE